MLDLAGVSDNRTLEGTARGWSTPQPCFPAMTIHRTGTANPVIAIDEVDKAGASRRNGDPLATLLTMIERSTAKCFFDKCLLAPIDLSHVNWILTANDIDRLPMTLRSRLDIVHVDRPDAAHFDVLLANMLCDLATRLELPIDDLPSIPKMIDQRIRSRFARHRSVRALARDIEAAIATLIRFTPRRTH